MSYKNQEEIALDALTIFQGGGEMGAMMRAYDWDNHPLGNPAYWSQSLKTNIRLLLNSGFPMFIWWSEDLYSFHNDAYLPALGKKHPEALGVPARVVWAEIWKDVGAVAEDILAGGKYYYADSLELFLERKGFPEETYWTFSYSPVYDDAGKVFGVFCACTEVTGSVLGQRRLKTLKDIADVMSQIQTLEQACQSACDILAQNRKDVPFSQIYLINRAETEAQVLGSSGDAFSGVPCTISLTDPETTGGWPLQEVLQTKKTVIVESLEKFITGRPEITQLAQRAAVIPIFRPGQDQLIGFFVTGISINLEYDAGYGSFHELLASQIATSIASVQTREEAARQQEELINLFEQAPVAICILRGAEYVVELANPGMCALWGKTLSDVLGKPAFEGIPEAKGQGLEELLDGVFTTGVPCIQSELPVLFPRGEKLGTVYVNFVYQPMRDTAGNITGIIAVAIEVNEQVEARQEIEAMNNELRAINADLDNFVYSASHDLKAPISNIEGLVDTLVEYLPADVQQEEGVQRVLSLMNSSLGRFKRAVADLTEVAKIQRIAGEDVASIDLAKVVADVELDFENIISSTGAQIENHFEPDSTVRFSAKNVRSIVYNLFSNALKYRSPDRTPEIKITTELIPGYMVLKVTDNGLGLKPEDKDKIFTMFKRLHDHVEGTGIGLYIVKRIVENAGGKIEVDSEKGVGTTFTVYFRK